MQPTPLVRMAGQENLPIPSTPVGGLWTRPSTLDAETGWGTHLDGVIIE